MKIIHLIIYFATGQIEFEEFCTLAARFLVEVRITKLKQSNLFFIKIVGKKLFLQMQEDAEAMQQELKEAFRLYDKEGTLIISLTHLKIHNSYRILKFYQAMATSRQLSCVKF